MKLNMIIKILFVSALFFINLDAKIIEAKQLFNKKITKVKEEDISLSKSYYGQTAIDESLVTDVVTRFDGFITKLNANKTFMNIKKDEPLFSIYSDDILSIQNEIQIAKDFNKSIYNSSLVKLQSLNIDKSEIAKIKKGQIGSMGTIVSSPISGILLTKNINNQSSVKKGMLLLQIANLEKLWFIASIYQKDLEYIKKDMQARVFIDGIEKPLNTKVDFIYPNVDTKTKTVDVRFELDNKDLSLYPSMFAKVEIKNTSKTMLTLPKTAVLSKGEKYYVFKPISEDQFEPIKIKAKRISTNKYQILDGLESGDEIIDNALFLLDSDALTNALYESDDEDW